jgi:CheY-like chemotaxis protein
MLFRALGGGASMAEILVVDDSATFRHVVCAQLREAGHRVSEATNGEEALGLLRASPVSLVVLLDVVMPKLGGIGVLDAVDNSPELARRHAFILVTATPHAIPPQAVAELLARQQVPILTKPCDPPQLLDLIASTARRLQYVPR